MRTANKGKPPNVVGGQSNCFSYRMCSFFYIMSQRYGAKLGLSITLSRLEAF